MTTTDIVAANFRYFVSLIFDPLCWLFFILLSLIGYIFYRKKDRVLVRWAWILLLLCIGLYGVTTPWLPHWMAKHLIKQYPRIHVMQPDIHWVVVLGGGVIENDTIPASDALNTASLKRLLEGLRLYWALPHAKLILSGGSVNARTKSVALRFDEFAAWVGVPATDRILEKDSINTADEARLIKPMVGDAPFYLVTSALHMPRAMRLFEQQGLHPIAAPCQLITEKRQSSWRSFLPDPIYLIYFKAICHECLGQVWARLRVFSQE